MADWSEGFVAANGLNIHYHRSGGDKTPILLLHGFTDNGLCWTKVARDLAENYDVVMTDARGHGRTEGPVIDLATDRLADDAAAFIRELGLDRPFLFGHSMGAITATAVAANYPDLVRGAVLEDPPFRESAPFDPQRLEEMRRQNLAFHDLPLAERLAQGRKNNPNWDDAELEPWAVAQGEYNPDIQNGRRGLVNYPWRDALARVKCPALLITAETAKGAIVSSETAVEVPHICPTCQVVFIEGAGHCIHRDKYAETMQVVTDFLGKNEQR